LDKQTILQVKTKLSTVSDLNDPLLKILKADPRKGVQLAINSAIRRIKRSQANILAFKHRFQFENELWQQGESLVAGIDEGGRGPLAGPVVTAAVILDDSFDLIAVTDSKQLSAHEREKLYLRIIQEAIEVNICVKDNAVIDKYNIYQATRLAMAQTVAELHHQPSHLIVDAVPIASNIPQITLIKGDQKSISVAAASIVAKEYRDHLMQTYDLIYPGYDFAHNMGYGTAKHLAGLKALGVTPIHRYSFSPVPNFERK